MLEAIVVVGVLLALAVGGFFAYGPITKNAKIAKVKSVASEVYTAATVALVDGDPATKPQDVLDAFNTSTDEIKVEFIESKPAIASMSTAGYTPADGTDFCVQATNLKNPDIQGKAGNCADLTDVGSAPEKEGVSPTLLTLKNGEFSDGLNFWNTGGANTPTPSNGEAILPSDSHQPTTLSQTVSIPSSGITHLKYGYRLDASSYNNSLIQVMAYDSTGKLLKEIKNTAIPSGPAVSSTWSTAELTEFAGQNIKLEFAFSNIGMTQIRNAYLDNVSIETTSEAPSAPLNAKSTFNVTDATISWDIPSSGASSVTSYTVTPIRNGVPLETITTTGEPPATSIVFKGVTSGADYTFTVSATNVLGTSQQSIPSEKYSSPVVILKNGDFTNGLNSWTTGGHTQANVVNEEAVLADNGGQYMTLAQPVSIPSSGISHLKYNYRVDSVGYNNGDLRVNVYDAAGTFIKMVKLTTIPPGAAIPTTTATVDLTPYAGKDIKVEFYYTNSGMSVVRKAYLDNISIQNVATAPSAPTEVKVSAVDTDATITWTAPVLGNASVSSYTVTPIRNGVPLAGITVSGVPPANTAVFKGLTSGGSYTFTVTATNSLGTSVSSAPSDSFLKPAKSLENGDFATDLTGWKLGGQILPTNVNGEAVLRGGGGQFVTLSQSVTIPSTGTTYLKYNYRVDSVGYNTGSITVKVYDAAGKFLKDVKVTTIPPGTAVPSTLATVDLAQFAGQDVKVEFYYTNSGISTQRSIYIDNVSVGN